MYKLANFGIHFVTFADGDIKIIAAGKRLIAQADDSKIFTKTSSCSKKYLENVLDQNILEFISPENRGYGYWIWKPLILSKLLTTEVEENEIVVYTDSGTELNINIISKIRFRKLIRQTESQPILAFNTKEPEYKFTKQKCINLLKDQSKAETFQVEATTVLIRNCEESRNFINEWIAIATSDNFSFIDDSRGDECYGFVDHRHDQSIFSILFKNNSYSAFTLKSPTYSDNPKRVSIFQRLAFNGFAFWPIRNRSGTSILKPWQSNSVSTVISLPFFWMNRPVYFAIKFLTKVYFYVISKINSA